MAKAKQDTPNAGKGLKRDAARESRKSEQQTAMQSRRGYELQQPRSPFALMRRFSEEMDRLFEDFGFGRGLSLLGQDTNVFGGQGPSKWSPQVEIFEREGELVVRADLPGMKKDDVEIDITGNTLVIHGERRSEHEEEEEGYYRTERSYGGFYRAIPLPEGVDTDNAEANFRDGVLEVTMGAPERAERRRLEINERDKERPRTRSAAAGQR